MYTYMDRCMIFGLRDLQFFVLMDRWILKLRARETAGKV
jgi:hypothetical protein